MKKFRLSLIVLGLVITLFASGCSETENEPSMPSEPMVTESEAPSEAPLIINAKDVYESAFAELCEADALTFDVEMSHTICVSDQLFAENISSIFSIIRNENGYEYYSSKTLNCGGVSGIIEECYSGNFISIVVDGEHKFYSICVNPDERCLPVILIDPSLYSNVEASKEGEMIRISFTYPSAAEKWALPDDAVFVEANGQVLVNPDGSVSEMRYSIRYENLVSEHEYEFVSRPRESVHLFSVPEIDSDYVFIDFADAPYYSLRTEGMVNQSTELSFSNSISVGLFATSMHDYAVANVDILGSGDDFAFTNEFEALAVFGVGAETVGREDHQSYKNGLYRDSTTGKRGIELDKEAAKNHVMKIFEEAEVPFDFWASAKEEDLGGVLLLKFRLSEAFAEEALSYISNQYYQDPEYIADWSSSINSHESYAYLTIDLSTGLPLSRGFYQLGTHELTDRDTSFSEQYFELEINQSVDCCSEKAYYNINKVYEEQLNESNVNPLLYRVNGQNGEKMWLLCGISMGRKDDIYPKALYEIIDECDNVMLLMPDNKESMKRYLEDTDYNLKIQSVQSYEIGTLKERLGEELFEKLANYMLVHATVFHDYTNLKAVAAYDAMSSIPYLVNHDTYYSTNDLIVDYAKHNGISVISAADTLEFLKIRNSISDETAVKCINDFMNSGNRIEAESYLEYYDTWKRGDEELLYELCGASYSADNPADIELAEESRLYDEILSRAAFKQLRSGECTFLILDPYMIYNDASGLVKTLTEAGYSVERVNIK